jgi:hypothetical protein
MATAAECQGWQKVIRKSFSLGLHIILAHALDSVHCGASEVLIIRKRGDFKCALTPVDTLAEGQTRKADLTAIP